MDFKNKKVIIYFDDKSYDRQVSKKDGFCIDDDNYAITIKNTSGHIEKIPYCRIVRVIAVGV